jgi:hypothetical protein
MFPFRPYINAEREGRVQWKMGFFLISINALLKKKNEVSCRFIRKSVATCIK